MREINVRNLDQLLEYTCSMKASDLHINVGSKPTLRLNSVLEQIPNTEVVTPEISWGLVKALLDDDKRAYLESNGEVDFSFSKPGLGRFRVNAYRQRGTYSLAIRLLPFEIPKFESLGLPQVIKHSQ